MVWADRLMLVGYCDEWRVAGFVGEEGLDKGDVEY